MPLTPQQQYQIECKKAIEWLKLGFRECPICHSKFYALKHSRVYDKKSCAEEAQRIEKRRWWRDSGSKKRRSHLRSEVSNNAVNRI